MKLLGSSCQGDDETIAACIRWAFDKGDFYHDPSARPNIPALSRNLAMLHELGFLSVTLDPTPYVDLSLIEEAGRRLK